MDLATLRVQLARRWWIVAAAALIALVGALAASASQADEHHRTIHLVLRPDAAVTDDDLPGTLDALQSDGPLVQNVIGVLGSDGMLRRVAGEAGLSLDGDYGVESVARPGSSLIDTTLSGPDEATLDQLARSYSQAAGEYVSASYSAYVLQQLSVDSSGGGGPGTLEVAILALLVGGALGVGLVVAESLLQSRPGPAARRRTPAPERVAPEDAPPPASPRLEPAANGGPVPTETAPVPAESPDASPAPTPPRRKAASGSKPATRARASSRSKTSGAKSEGGSKAPGTAKSRTKPKRATETRSQAKDRPPLEVPVDDLGSSDGAATAGKPATRAPASPPKPEVRGGGSPTRRPARGPRATSPKRPPASTEED
jgi:hypothetical protein